MAEEAEFQDDFLMHSAVEMVFQSNCRDLSK